MNKHNLLSLPNLIFKNFRDYYLFFRDEKQIDFADQLESVAYCLCGEDPIVVDQFIQIFNTKGVS